MEINDLHSVNRICMCVPVIHFNVHLCRITSIVAGVEVKQGDKVMPVDCLMFLIGLMFLGTQSKLSVKNPRNPM
jgi:hypothetical protein